MNHRDISYKEKLEDLVDAALGELNLSYKIEVFQPQDRSNPWSILLQQPEDKIKEVKVEWGGATTTQAKDDIKLQLKLQLLC